MTPWLKLFLGWRLRKVLIASFCLCAGLTVGVNPLASSLVIQEYLTTAESMLVARQLELDEVSAISHRPALDPSVIQNLNRAFLGNADAIPIIDQQIINKITVFTSGGGGIHLIAVLNPRGDVIVGRLVNQTGTMGFLARGDLGVQVHALGNGERDVLGRSFNDMVN